MTTVLAVVAFLPATAHARYCGRVDPASGRYFVQSLYARNVSCSRAAHKLREWLVVDGPQYDPPGYHCAVSTTYHFRCRSGDRRLVFDVRRYYR